MLGKKYGCVDGLVINASCQRHVAVPVSLAKDALMVLAEALPLLTRTLQHPSQHPSWLATMLLILGRVTLCGSACNVPLVTGSEFQQKAERVYPLFCCLTKCLHRVGTQYLPGTGRRSLILPCSNTSHLSVPGSLSPEPELLKGPY